MKVFLRLSALVAMPLVLGAGEFYGFSLAEAQRRLLAGASEGGQVSTAGPITRLAGLVYDRRSRDLIVVGEADSRASPVQLNDLVVALRAVLLRKEYPYVSIDPVGDTEQSGVLAVTFKGGIEDTPFGRALLDADILLKQLSLGVIAVEIWGLKSYFSLSVDELAKATGDIEDRIGSRFWFYPKSTSLAIREGVGVIRESVLDVETRVDYATINGRGISDLSKVRDSVGDRFTALLRASYDDLSAAYPVLGQLRTLLDLTALARAITEMEPQPDLNYWLHEYRVSNVTTARKLTVIRKEQEVGGLDGKTRRLRLHGGIELNPVVLRLHAGDETALRDAVLQARPESHSLVWKVDLQGWRIPGAPAVEEFTGSSSGPHRPAFSLDRQTSVFGRDTTSFFPASLSRQVAALPPLRVQAGLIPQRYSSQVGGVMLSDVARFEDRPGKVDLADGNFSLIVNGENARLDPRVFRKFVTALWAVYFGRQDPGISIDPIYMDPETGRFSEKHLVRYIGRVANTDLGRVMRDADYQMKKWSVGTERADVRGFKSPDEIAGRSGIRYLSLSRFWLVPEDMKFKSAENMLLFDRGRMTVKTEVIGSSIGEKQADPHNEEFARFFTDHYEEISRQHPIYQELFEYAKLVALAKYLKESGVPLFWFLMANRDLILTEDSPGTVDNLAKGSAYWQGLTIQGGVDLATKGQYVYDAPALKALREAMEKAAARPGRSTSLSYSKEQTVPAPFSFGLGPERYSVTPQHSLSAGKDRRGILYQTDFALRAEGYLVTQGLLDRLRAEMVRQRARRVLAPLVRGIPEAELSARLPALVSSAFEKSSQEMGPLLKRLENLRNREFKTEGECGQAWDDVAGVGEAAEWRPFFVKWAHFISNLELVRYFNPRLQERGEFGAGWRLLIPYRVKPVDQATVRFLNALIPRQMEVENLVSGRSERLTFSADRYAAAGYVPDRLESSQFIGLFLLSDASFRLVDKIGSEFQFDPAGFLTDLLLSDDHRLHIEYAGEVREAFEEQPYSIEPADRERIAFLNAQIPKSMIVKDRIHNQSEVLSFSKKGEIAGYVPADADKSRYKILALLSDASFQLMHREGSVVSFAPSGEFERLELDAAKRVPSSISMGNHKVAFRYTTDPDGRLLIASAQLLRDTASAVPTHIVRYEYDREGRLTQAKRQAIQEAAARYEKPQDISQGAATPGLGASIR